MLALSLCRVEGKDLMSDVVPYELIDKADEAVVRAEAYLLGRQCSVGGFSYYKSEYVEEPNLGDTYHTVAALNLIRAEIPHRDAIVDFLEGAGIYGPGYLYCYAFTLDLMGFGSRVASERLGQIRSLDVRAPDARFAEGVSRWLQETLDTVLLQRRFGHLQTAAPILDFVRGLKNGGGFGMTLNLLDTSLGVAILSTLDEDGELSDSRTFVGELQAPYFGFTLTASSRATSLETIHAGVKCCRMLGIDIRHPVDVLEFVLSCQKPDGSFSRAPVALPDIELTHQALEVIVAIVGERLFSGR
jgi:hypothetical protein